MHLDTRVNPRLSGTMTMIITIVYQVEAAALAVVKLKDPVV